jgi:hypothetical protein
MLSNDAIIFGIGHLNGGRATLSFGGDGAKMKITDRARAALNDLLKHGYAEPFKPDNGWVNREGYRGVNKVPHLGALLRGAGVDPFNIDSWPTFVGVET